MKFINYTKKKIMYFIAKIFRSYVYGIDYAKGRDKSVRCEGYMFRKKVYIKSIKEI